MNTFTLKYKDNVQEGVYIEEPQWDEITEISSDLVDDSPYIELIDIPEAKSKLEITVKNGKALYEITKFDQFADIYTCKLLIGEVYS